MFLQERTCGLYELTDILGSPPAFNTDTPDTRNDAQAKND